MDDVLTRQRRWQAAAALLAMAVLLASLPLALPLAFLADRGVSLVSLDWVKHYFQSLPGHPAYWLETYRRWISQGFRDGHLPSVLLLPALLGLAVLALAALFNPYRAPSRLHGAARWARTSDLRRMKLLQGRIIVLGRWGRRRLHMPETLSALCIAPPGTGKTVAVVVPTILDGDEISMIINDVKPELHQITSGHRQRLGPVYRLEWAARDEPEQGLVHARWNPLSPGCLPTAGAARDLYIDRLAALLIADPLQGDPHWSRKGRAALAGLTHFIVAKCEAERREGEPSFPMLL